MMLGHSDLEATTVYLHLSQTAPPGRRESARSDHHPEPPKSHARGGCASRNEPACRGGGRYYSTSRVTASSIRTPG